MDKLILAVKNFIVEQKEVTQGSPRVLYVKGYANRYLDSNGQLVVDRSGDSVVPTGYDLENYLKNPILLSYHSKTDPVGKIIDLKVTIEGLEITAEVHELLNPTVFYAVEQGILKSFSIGFKALDTYYDVDKDIYYYRSVELLEVSIVSVPDNQDSLFTVLTQSPCTSGYCMLASKATDEHTIKCASKIKNKALSTQKWSEVDKSTLQEQIVATELPEAVKEAYLIVGDIDKSSTWKFPHHDFVDESLVLNKEGLLSALSALKSAKDVEKFSIEEKVTAIKHLDGHFKELVELGVMAGVPEEINDLLQELTTEKEVDDNLDDTNKDIEEEGDSNPTQHAEGDTNNAEGGETKPAEISFEQIISYVESLEGSDENINALLSLYDAAGLRVNTLINAHLTQN